MVALPVATGDPEKVTASLCFCAHTDKAPGALDVTRDPALALRVPDTHFLREMKINLILAARMWLSPHESLGRYRVGQGCGHR